MVGYCEKCDNTSVAERDEIGDEHFREADDPATTDTLHTSTCEQCCKVLCDGADNAADGEEYDS